MFRAFLLLAAVICIRAQCPNGTVYFAGSDKCYYAVYCSDMDFADTKDWFEARLACQGMGGDLVSIHSDAENQFVLGLRTSCFYNYWIGYHQPIGSNVSVWSDGSATNYSKSISEPGSCGDDTGYQLLSTGDWQCDPEVYSVPYICEVPKSSGPTSGPLTTPAPGSCPSGSTSFQNKCYTFNNNASSWQTAKSQCYAQNGDLVSIHSSAENAFIASNMAHVVNGVYWIGLNREMEPIVNYTWSDGSSVDYQNWNSGVPGACLNGAQNCVSVEGGSADWYNCWSCSKALPFVCEVSTKMPSVRKAKVGRQIRHSTNPSNTKI